MEVDFTVVGIRQYLRSKEKDMADNMGHWQMQRRLSEKMVLLS